MHCFMQRGLNVHACASCTRTDYKNRGNIRVQRSHLHACTDVLHAPLCFTIRQSCGAVRFAYVVSSVTADFSIEPFSNGTQDANVCAHSKFRCGRYNVPIRIAIFGNDKSRYCGPEFSFRAGMRNMDDKNDIFRDF